MSNESAVFTFPVNVPESITGPRMIAQTMDRAVAIANAMGKPDAASRGLGLAVVLTMVAYGSISRKANPFAPAKGKGSFDAQGMVAAMDHVMPMVPSCGRGTPLAKADLAAAFEAFVGVHAATVDKVKTERKASTKVKTAPATVTAPAEAVDEADTITVHDTDQAPNAAQILEIRHIRAMDEREGILADADKVDARLRKKDDADARIRQLAKAHARARAARIILAQRREIARLKSALAQSQPVATPAPIKRSRKVAAKLAA